MNNKTKIIFKVTYYNQGKLNIKKTIVSHAGFYAQTKLLPFLEKIDYFIVNNKWPTTSGY